MDRSAYPSRGMLPGQDEQQQQQTTTTRTFITQLTVLMERF